MDKPTELVEYETMLLGRHVFMTARTTQNVALERSAYILLSRLHMQGPMSVRQLSDAFGLDTSTLNRQTAALMRTGLIERIPDPLGGIARKFRLTEDGERRLEEARVELVNGLNEVLTDWTADDVTAFAALLKRFNTDMERMDGRPWPRP